jgi:hypothetical protein
MQVAEHITAMKAEHAMSRIRFEMLVFMVFIGAPVSREDLSQAVAWGKQDQGFAG